ncbi:MAG: hypothetical protein JO009_02620 [Candidatus Eremiobacteraeota bacterium]|nr:hypothetical protein [Candidatus Eremiobacteraeota bacterium]
MHGMSRRKIRGVALITALFAVVLVLALLAVMVDVGTARLRQAAAMLRAQQALAAADAGTAWVRALLTKHSGDLSGVLDDLSAAHSTTNFAIDAETNAEVVVGLDLPGDAKHTDHLDVNLQQNPAIGEAPLQVVATATLSAHGRTLATRTVTTLVRRFALSPYSEVVGVVDDASVLSDTSPGDPGGQVGTAYATDLRIHAYTETGSGPPVPANLFKNDSWSDGNRGGSGILP